MLLSGVKRVTGLLSEGIVNGVATVDYSGDGGIADQWYQEGCFALEDDGALVVEVSLSEACREFSLSLTDAYFSTLDWANAQSSLNHRQASIDGDGVLRLVVSPTDPSVQNWLDTTGHRFGVLQFRWSGGDEAPAVQVRKVASAEVLEILPRSTVRVSASERIAAVRQRQIGAQLRSLW
jgi:hypothetical protein